MQDAEQKLPKKHSAAVVIGAGGIRSLAGLPLLEHLKKASVIPDTIISTGGGSVLAALFACGFPSDEIPGLMAKIFDGKLYDKLHYSKILQIFGLRSKPFTAPPAPYKNAPILKALKSVFGEIRLEDLPYHLQIHCTEMSTGNVVCLDKGSVVDCLYATNATYPFLPPIELEGKFLAGGVFTAAIPLLTAVKQHYDVIFLLSFNDDRQIQTQSFFEYVNTFFIRSCTNVQARQIALAISLHHGETVLMNIGFNKSISLWDATSLSEILETGKKVMNARLEDINEAILSLT